MKMGKTYHWEIDMGTQRREDREAEVVQVRRLRRVHSHRHNEARSESGDLMAQASEAKSLALFGVIEDILKDPVGKVWTDVTGKICALPKPSAKATAK